MISIIIPTWNNYNDFKICINSILNYTYLDDKEIIVVANGSGIETINYIKELNESKITILEYPKPLGFARAVNEGIRASKGDYIVVLNDDVYLLDQEKDKWIKLLLEPFLEDKEIGITGALKLHYERLATYFLVFFCVMIKREVIEKVGLLDELFAVGGGEDIDYCIRSLKSGYKIKQVPNDTILTERSNNRYISTFPIYHKAEATVEQLPNWKEIFDNNMKLLEKKHSNNIKQSLCNEYERAVIDDSEAIPAREHIRYEYAKKKNRGKRILDIGCSTGFGFRYFKDNPEIEYTGIDYDENTIKYAKQLYKNYRNANFICADINSIDIDFYDTIIAYEVLEHLDNGFELAQKLKAKCNQLFITVPYDEPPGFWGKHHKLHHIKEEHFPDFKYKYITENGVIISKPNNRSTFYLLLLEWDRYGHYADNDIKVKVLHENTVTATISTKNRYYTTLPLTLQSLLNQTKKPQKIWIYDDSEDTKDLRAESLYRHIFGMANDNNVEIYVWIGEKVGQVANHNHALYNANTEYIWRIDDDCVAMPDTLEIYLDTIRDNKVGAVGGRVIFADRPILNRPWYAKNSFKTKIEFEPSEWYKFDEIREAEHLHSTFLYKVEAGLKANGYPMNLSPVGHREETIFSHNIYRQGYKLLLNPKARTYHYHNTEGGIRTYKNPLLWAKDEEIYQSIIKYEWGYDIPDGNIVVLAGGIGDNFAFKLLLNEYLEKKKEILIATPYPDVFYDTNVAIISLEKAMSLIGDINKYNIYKFMIDTNFNGYILDAYRRLYL